MAKNLKEVESTMEGLAKVILDILDESIKDEDLDARYFLAIDIRQGNEGRVSVATDIPRPMLTDWMDALKGRLEQENEQAEGVAQ